MSVKQSGPEGVYGLALPDPCATVKAGLPEPQAPGMEPVIRRPPRLTRRHRDTVVQSSRPQAFRTMDGGQ